jgi:hypothetical protein
MAHTVNFTWNANAEPDIDHYDLYAGTQTAIYALPGSPKNMGNATSGSFDVDFTGTGFYALKAVNTGGQASPFSSEVSQAVDTSQIGGRTVGTLDSLGAMASF